MYIPNFTILSISLLPAKQPLAIIYCLEYWWIAKVSSNFDMRKNESSRLPSWENDELILQFEKWQCWTLWKGKTTTLLAVAAKSRVTQCCTRQMLLLLQIYIPSILELWMAGSSNRFHQIRDNLKNDINAAADGNSIFSQLHMNWILWGYEVGIVVTCYQWENNLDLLSFPFG